MKMRDENDNLKERNDDLSERMKDVVADIKEERIACNKCTVAKGKGREVPYIPKQVLTKKVEVGETAKIVERKVEKADIPAYRNNVGSFANERCDIPKKSWPTVAKGGDKDGFTKVVGKAERKMVAKKMNIVKHNISPLREKHLKIKFLGRRGIKHTLLEGVSPENVRVKLNSALKSFNIDEYFSIVGRNR